MSIMLRKNTASQNISLWAVDSATGLFKSGDALNIVLYVQKDDGAVTAIASNSGVPAEVDATNAKGQYRIALSQAETNGDKLTFTGKSSTSGIREESTIPATGLLAPATAGRTLVVDAAGLADANAVKVGPTGSGTAQTARDIGASVLLAASQHVIVDSGTVTTLTNLPSIPANWITAAGINAAALNGKGDWNTTTPPTTAQIVTAIFTDLMAGSDFSTVASFGALVKANLDANVGSRMATYTQPTGFLAATFPGTVASPTNITAASGVSLAASQHVIVDSGTVTNLTNLPAAAALASQIPANFTAALFASAGVFSVGALANAPTGGGTAPTVLQIAAGVLDVAGSSHNIAGSIGAFINAAGGAADPLLNTVPGSYASGTAGAALGRIGSGQIVTTSPVDQLGNFKLVQGATYYAADGQSIDFIDASAGWPNLTGGSVQLRGYFGSQLYTHAGSIVTAGGGSQKVRFEFSATDTAAYALGARPFDVIGTLANGHAVLLLSVQGTINAL
jgi:hypothetical protein